MKSKSVKALYERIGDKYYENKSRAIGDYTELLAVMSLAGEGRGRRVLGAGCGPGRHSKRLLDEGATVTGRDISPEVVQIASKYCDEKADIFQADFEQVKFKPASF